MLRLRRGTGVVAAPRVNFLVRNFHGAVVGNGILAVGVRGGVEASLSWIILAMTRNGFHLCGLTSCARADGRSARPDRLVGSAVVAVLLLCLAAFRRVRFAWRGCEGFFPDPDAAFAAALRALRSATALAIAARRSSGLVGASAGM